MNTIYLSEHAGKPLVDFLRRHGFHLVFVTGKNDDGGFSPVYEEIRTHADIYMCQLGLWEDSRIFAGDKAALGKYYPENIIYNALCSGKYFIHNFKYTSAELAKAVFLSCCEKSSAVKVNVRQGYTRCCCLPVDERSFITSDKGIAEALSSAGADVLLIKAGYITLKGFDYGFIGGCGGNILIDGKRTVIINGSLNTHPDYPKIRDFINARGISLVFFEEYPLEDIGSILLDAGRR